MNEDDFYGFYRPGDIVRGTEQCRIRGASKTTCVGRVFTITSIEWRADLKRFTYTLDHAGPSVVFLSNELEHTDEAKRLKRTAELARKNVALAWLFDAKVTLVLFVIVFLLGRITAPYCYR